MREPTDYTLYLEAVARNPPRGPGAWGCILVDRAGLAVLEDTGVARPGLPVTRAAMELTALTAGLRLAGCLRLPIRALTVQCPTALLVSQMTGRADAGGNLWRQAAEARRLARRIRCEQVRFAPLAADRSPATGLAQRAFAEAAAGNPLRPLTAVAGDGPRRSDKSGRRPRG